MSYALGSKSLRNLDGVHPSLITVIKEAIKISDVDFSVLAGVRTAEEQNKLYQKGRTISGKIVTSKDGYSKKSNHQAKPDGYGHAVDMVPYVNGVNVWEWDYIFPIALAMNIAGKDNDVNIRWGGNWYTPITKYGSTLADMKIAEEDYKRQHAGSDFIDGPHFEILI